MNSTLPVRLALAFAIAFAGCAGLRGQTAAPSATWTLTPMVVSQYMFRGLRLSGPAFQPTLEYGYGDVTAGLWASVPLDDAVPGVSDPEIDLYGSHTTAINAATTIVVGATWYTFPEADRSAGAYKMTFEPSLALNYTIDGFRLTPKVYYDVTLEGITAELGAFYALPLQRLGTELDFTGVVGTYKWKEAAENATPAVKNWGDYWSLGVTMPFQVAASSRVLLGVAYMKGTNNHLKQGSAPRTENRAAGGRGVVSIGYSVTF